MQTNEESPITSTPDYKAEVVSPEEMCAMFEKREKQFDDEERLILRKAFSAYGGIFTEGKKEDEIDSLSWNTVKSMTELEYKYIDVVRKRMGLPPDEMDATFGEDFENRWRHLVQNHIVKDENGNELNLYEDTDGNYRVIRDAMLTFLDMEFIMKNPDKFPEMAPNIEDEKTKMPTINIWGLDIEIPEEWHPAEYSKDVKIEYKQQLVTIARFIMNKVMSIDMKGIKDYVTLLSEIKDKL
jgi:hypothetical protein